MLARVEKLHQGHGVQRGISRSTQAGKCDPDEPPKFISGEVAEGVGFEPTVGINPQRFSRPSHSAALAPFRLATLSVWVWRRGWDSNPRKLALHALSKRADSAALAPLRIVTTFNHNA